MSEVYTVGDMVWVVADFVEDVPTVEVPAPLCSASRGRRLTGEQVADLRSRQIWAAERVLEEHCRECGFVISDLM